MSSGDATLAVVLLVILTCGPSAQDTMLFVATPGGGTGGAGLYGAVIDGETGRLRGDLSYDFKFGFHCTHDDGAVKREFDLQSAAYDPVSGYILLQRQERSPSDVITLYEGHVCQNGGGCGKKGARVLFERVLFRYTKPRSFAYHDRQIYFLSQETRSDSDDDRLLNVIELRRFAGCGSKYPVTPSTSFEIRDCSERLATLVSERVRRPTLEPMSGLRLLVLDGRLYAFAVLQELVFDDADPEHLRDVVVGLYAVRIGRGGDEESTVRVLHRERIGHATYRRYIMKQLGNVDYLDDKICWSAYDRILCADFFSPRERLSRVRYIVPPGGAKDIVCKGESIYANITTGVALADVVDDEVRLFFGCLADAAGIGGSGFVYMRHWEYDVIPTPRRFTNSSSEIYSGQMFISDKCKYIKKQDAKRPGYREYDLQSDEGAVYHQAPLSGATVRRQAVWIIAASALWIRAFVSG